MLTAEPDPYARVAPWNIPNNVGVIKKKEENGESNFAPILPPRTQVQLAACHLHRTRPAAPLFLVWPFGLPAGDQRLYQNFSRLGSHLVYLVYEWSDETRRCFGFMTHEERGLWSDGLLHLSPTQTVIPMWTFWALLRMFVDAT
jgi:hypothetical protein